MSYKNPTSSPKCNTGHSRSEGGARPEPGRARRRKPVHPLPAQPSAPSGGGPAVSGRTGPVKHPGGRPVAGHPARSCTRPTSTSVTARRSVPFGMCCRTSPLVCPVGSLSQECWGGGELEASAERLGYAGVARELPAVVRRDRVYGDGGRTRHRQHRGGERGRGASVNPLEKRVSQRSVHERDHRPAAPLSARGSRCHETRRRLPSRVIRCKGMTMFQHVVAGGHLTATPAL